MLPFTTAQFLEVFTRYNEGVWPMQAVLLAAALATLVLARQNTAAASRRACAILALLWAWMALAYHLRYFASVNPAAPVFAALFLVQAAAFLWLGVVRGRVALRTEAPRARIGWALAILALVAYPAVGYLLGHRYPAIPTFGLPCPTTILTLAILHFAVPVPRGLLAIPLLWSAIGASAAFQLGVSEDLALLAAGVASLPLLHRRALA